jgi:hypothetical protein
MGFEMKVFNSLAVEDGRGAEISKWLPRIHKVYFSNQFLFSSS